jgi:hypothetical protein
MLPAIRLTEDKEFHTDKKQPATSRAHTESKKSLDDWMF